MICPQGSSDFSSIAKLEGKLDNKLITLDPLHNKTETLPLIVGKGGDSLVGTKANTSTRLDASHRALEEAPLF